MCGPIRPGPFFHQPISVNRKGLCYAHHDCIPQRGNCSRLAVRPDSQLSQTGVAVEKGTKAVISVNFSVDGGRTFNTLTYGRISLLAHFGKEGVPETVIPKISQETLADMIGTTRSRVSFFMNKFRKLGFVNYNGGSGPQVHTSLLNVVLHD